MPKWKLKSRALAVAFLAACIFSGSPARAKLMYSFDLDSLVYMASTIVEAKILSTREENWTTIAICEVEEVYAGSEKAKAQITVGLSGYTKQEGVPFASSDHLFLFLQPVSKERKDLKYSFWPAASGVKLIDAGKVSGSYQQNNPGCYVPSVDDGEIARFKKALRESLQFTETFKRDFEKNKDNANWLLESLKARKQKKLANSDRIAVVLCQALVATHDTAAIDRARALRTNHNELQILNQK